MEIKQTSVPRGTTEQFAKIKRVKPETVLKRLSKHGSYFGTRPVEKLENGRWEWPLTPNEESTK